MMTKVGVKGELRWDTAPEFPTNCGCFRRQPVGCVRAAAPGYHYTLDHLLPL